MNTTSQAIQAGDPITAKHGVEPVAPRGADEPAAPAGVFVSQPTVTLVEGSSFCVSGQEGDIDPHRADGLFVWDTRVVSRWQLLVDGSPVDPLTVLPAEPYECVFVGRAPARAGHPDATLIVERHRFVGQGLREDVTLRNYGREAAGVDLTLVVDVDFADLFQVKEGRGVTGRPVGRKAQGGDLLYWLEQGTPERGVRITAPGARASGGTLSLRAVVPPQGTWTTTVEVLPSIGHEELEAAFPKDRPVENARPAQRMQGWRASAPRVAVADPALAEALAWSRRDLGALRIVDPEHPEDDVVAAGAPWFMALFGRDSLLTSWMTLPFWPELSLGTLRTLARLQGTKVNVMTEEEPGRILHEVRLGADLSLALGGESVYYGSIDSTLLFVMLVGRALRWGVPREQLEELLPAVDAALRWAREHGDRDGDGFVEYRRGTDRGLLHQGWKDSFDGISFHNGDAAVPSIALAEVQGYHYAALLAKADIELAWGRPEEAARWRAEAADLKRRFHEAYWVPERGFYAVALDRDKRQVDSVTSNIGHCLWTGIVDEAVAAQVVERLVSPAMFTGHGIRTLSRDCGAYNPVSYHNGSVWPHDTALTVAGIARYGFTAEAQRVSAGLLDAAHAFGGRLPELFCGFSRDEKPVPVPYPTSCSPQAWAAAAPFELLRTRIGLEPDRLADVFRASPLPAGAGEVTIDALPFGGSRVSLRADDAAVTAAGLPEDVRFETGTSTETGRRA